MSDHYSRVLVAGDGAWGTAAALVLARKGVGVTIWGYDPEYVREVERTRRNDRFLPGVPIPDSISYATDLAEALPRADLVLSVTPAQHLRGVWARMASVYPPDLPVVSLSKGIERETLLRMTQVLEQVLGARRIAALSGPSHAEEVARQLPTTVAVSSADPGLAGELQDLLSTPYFRVYTNADTLGVELGGAVKNTVAIAAGACDGLELGDNAKAALVSRGLVELARLGVAMGACRETFFGLSGLGDLVTTCYSRHGRNRALGEALGRGRTLEEHLGATPQVVEGVWSTESILALSRRHGVSMPIVEQVSEVLNAGKPVAAAVEDLMTRRTRPEEEPELQA